MKNRFLFLIASLFVASSVAAQSSTEIGGEPLKALSQYQKGKYSEYAKEYKRMCEKYSGDDSFKDYFNDGNRYTVLVPSNEAMDIFRTENKKNDPRLRNTIKHSIIKGQLDAGSLADGQTIRSLWVYKSAKYTVSVKKKSVSITDMQGNSVRLGKSFTVGNITFYPVNTVMRY